MERPDWYGRDFMIPSDEGDREALRHAQRVLRCVETGELDHETKVRLRGFQALLGLRPNGYLDLPTAVQIERVRNQYA